MKRLTKRDEHGNIELIGVDTDNMLTDCVNEAEVNRFLKALNRLAEYEDAEEQGLLVRLPCKVGDTVYRIVDRGYLKDTCETDCYSCDILCPYEGRKYERVIEIKPWEMANIPVIANAMERLGKTVFLTREAAEKALEDA